MIFLSRLNILNAILTLNGELFVNALRYMILPAVAVGTIPMAIIARMTRSSVLETLGQDYVRTARAKGLRELRVVIGHAVRNAMLPVVTIIGLNFGGLVSGAVLTETIFGLTGVGQNTARWHHCARLYAGTGLHHCDRRLLRADQSRGRSALRLSRSPYPLELIEAFYGDDDHRKPIKLQKSRQEDAEISQPVADTLRTSVRNRSAIIGLTLIGFLIAVALFAPLDRQLRP